MAIIYRTSSFLPLSGRTAFFDDDYVLIEIVVYILATAGVGALGWLTDKTMEPPEPPG